MRREETVAILKTYGVLGNWYAKMIEGKLPEQICKAKPVRITSGEFQGRLGLLVIERYDTMEDIPLERVVFPTDDESGFWVIDEPWFNEPLRYEEVAMELVILSFVSAFERLKEKQR